MSNRHKPKREKRIAIQQRNQLELDMREARVQHFMQITGITREEADKVPYHIVKRVSQVVSSLMADIAEHEEHVVELQCELEFITRQEEQDATTQEVEAGPETGSQDAAREAAAPTVGDLRVQDDGDGQDGSVQGH